MFIESTPNPKLAQTLQNGNYNINAATEDIIDNSRDAGASIVDVVLDAPNLNKPLEAITIVDNGCGMNKKTLSEAIRYGADTDHDSNDIGNYGIGLKTAGTSQGNRIKITTKTKRGKVWVGVLDLDHIIKTRKWEVWITEANAEEENTFISYLKDSTGQTKHGTVVRIENITHKTPSRTQQTKLLKRTALARTYGECENFVLKLNGQVVKPNPIDRKRVLTATPDNPEGWLAVETESEYQFRVFFPLGEKTEDDITAGAGRKSGLELLVGGRIIGSVKKMRSHDMWGANHKLSGMRVQIRKLGDQRDFYKKDESCKIKPVYMKDNFEFKDSNFKKQFKEALAPWLNTAKAKFEKYQEEKDRNAESTEGKIDHFINSLDSGKLERPVENNDTCRREPETKDRDAKVINIDEVRDSQRRKKCGSRGQGDDVWDFPRIFGESTGRFYGMPSFEPLPGGRKKYVIPLNMNHPWVQLHIEYSKELETSGAALQSVMAHALEEIAATDADEYAVQIQRLSMRLLNLAKSDKSYKSKVEKNNKTLDK